MGFFDKIKKMVGKTGVELDYAWIENPFPFGDPMIKATLRIRTTGDVTVVGATGTFYAQREDADGMNEEIVLGEDECSDIEINDDFVDMPQVVKADTEASVAFFISDMDLVESLKEWGIDSPEAAKIKKVKFFLRGEVDIKETVGLFDPELTQEIEVVG